MGVSLPAIMCVGECALEHVCVGVWCARVHVCGWLLCLVHTRVGSTTRLPSHSAQVKETRRSMYDSELGMKKMAVGHHLGERSHTIERSHNLVSGERVERQDFVNLEEGRSEWVWDQCGV